MLKKPNKLSLGSDFNKRVFQMKQTLLVLHAMLKWWSCKKIEYVLQLRSLWLVKTVLGYSVKKKLNYGYLLRESSKRYNQLNMAFSQIGTCICANASNSSNARNVLLKAIFVSGKNIINRFSNTTQVYF